MAAKSEKSIDSFFKHVKKGGKHSIIDEDEEEQGNFQQELQKSEEKPKKGPVAEKKIPSEDSSALKKEKKKVEHKIKKKKKAEGSTTTVEPTEKQKATEPDSTLKQSSLTSHFKVRRSGRKPKSKLKNEKYDQMMQKILDEDESGLEVRVLEDKGRGVFAMKEFAKDDLICEYVGELIDYNLALEREKEYATNPEFGCYSYFFQFKNKKYCVDATKESERLGRLLNHSKTDSNEQCFLKPISAQLGLISQSECFVLDKNMDWRNNRGDQSSEANSIISLDRCSDDTDFLVGHNISFHGNDSFVEAHSSTTTDLMYQQELTDTDLQVAKQDAKGKTSIYQSGRYSPGSNSPPKTNYQFKYSQNAGKFTQAADTILTKNTIDFEQEAKKSMSDEPMNQSGDAKPESKKTDDLILSKSAPKTATNGFAKINNDLKDNNWKFRSLNEKFDDNSTVSRREISEKKEQKRFSESYTGYLADYDSKVKEGEDLLARLLGKVYAAEKPWTEPPNIDRDSQGDKEPISRVHGHVKSKTKETSKEELPSDSKDSLAKSTGSFKQLENKIHSHEHGLIDGNFKVRSFTTSSDQSRASRSDNASVSSQERFSPKGLAKDERFSSNSSSQKVSGSPRFGKSPKQSEPGSQQSKSSYHLEYSGSINEPKNSLEKSPEDKQIGLSDSYKEWQNLKSSLKKELDRKSSTSSSNKAFEKVSQEMSNMQTSTPQKSGWPVSPIRYMMDSDVKESEAILANKELKLKMIRVEIEQEVIRKEAILQEKLAEEHKKQAVATRSELMNVEQQRNECQRKLTDITDELNRQKKELESIPEELKESNIGTKIVLLQDERDELRRECRILREKCKEADYLNTTNMDLMKKVRNLQEQLYNEQDSSREKQRSLKEDLEREKRKIVDANIEHLNVIRKVKEEAIDAKKVEINSIMERLEKDKLEEIDSLKERCQKEIRSMQRRVEELEDDNQRTVESNRERLAKVQEMTESNFRKESEIAMKRQQKEKEAEISLCVQRHRREIEELEIRINAKQSEIDTLQAMLRQQEDSTRLLGEKLRTEAKDQICMAVEKERNSRLEELQETELELEKVKEERDSIARGNVEELVNKEKENDRLRNLVNKLKRELDDAKHDNYEAREEKLQAISRTRLEVKEDVDRLKGKIRELQRMEQTVFLDINEECLKTAAVTENSYPPLKRNYDYEDASPIAEALNVLKISNNDLRKQLMTCKKRFDESRVLDESTDQLNKSDSTSTCDKTRTPDSLKVILNSSSEESKSARILKHLQSRVKQLRQGNQSMKKSFGSDEGETDPDNVSGSSSFDQADDSPRSSKTQNLENSLKRAEDQAQKYANLLSQKMAENTKLQKMLTHASKENIKLERHHAVLQQKLASSGGK
eukprot:gene14323-15812_t